MLSNGYLHTLQVLPSFKRIKNTNTSKFIYFPHIKIFRNWGSQKKGHHNGDEYANTQTQIHMAKLTNINLKSIKTLSCYMFLEENIYDISKQSMVIHSFKPVCWDKPCKRMSHNGEYKGRGGECQVQLARQAWSHHLRQPFQKDKNEEKAQGTIKNLRSLSYR